MLRSKLGRFEIKVLCPKINHVKSHEIDNSDLDTYLWSFLA